MKYAWIKQHAPEFPVGAMCRFTKVSRSAYYAWLNRSETEDEKSDAELTVLIKSVFNKSRATYGTRRIKEALLKRDRPVSRRRIGRLMRESHLACKTKRKFKVTTDSKHNLPVASNHLDRQFTVDQPNQSLCGRHYLYSYLGRVAVFGGRD